MKIQTDGQCSFCTQAETLDHLLFECRQTREIWRGVLAEIKIDHSPKEWKHELKWLCSKSKGKGWIARIIKIAAAETVYAIWLARNRKIFDNVNIDMQIIQQIVNIVIR